MEGTSSEYEGMAEEWAKADALRPARRIDKRVTVNDWTPGTAIVYKGEPSATELAFLQFPMSTDERAAIDGIVGQIVSRHRTLSESGEDAVQKYFEGVVDTINEQGRATPIVEVWDDAPDYADVAGRNGNGSHPETGTSVRQNVD